MWAVKESPTFRIAVIGVGHWHAPRYIATLNQLGEKIVAVWDTDSTIASKVAGELGVPTEPDLGDLLKATHPDVIVGMGIHSIMPGLIAAMLETPAALVLEKPLGIHAADVEPLAEKIERQGRFAAVAFVNRYTPIWSRIQAMAESGRLGRPSYAYFRIISGSPARYVRDGNNWMLEPELSGGGCLINLGIHALDAFRLFAREPVSVHSSQFGYLVHQESIEDYACALLRSQSGIVGSIEAGYFYPAMAGVDQEWRLVTGNAYLIQKPEGLVIKTMDDNKIEHVPVMSSVDAYHLFLADSLRRLRQGKEPVATFRDGLEALRLVETIYRTAERIRGAG